MRATRSATFAVWLSHPNAASFDEAGLPVILRLASVDWDQVGMLGANWGLALVVRVSDQDGERAGDEGVALVFETPPAVGDEAAGPIGVALPMSPDDLEPAELAIELDQRFGRRGSAPLWGWGGAAI